MAINTLNYIQISPNIRLIVNQADQYETKFNLHLVSGGSYFEGENEKGLTHLLEHCMVSRTHKLDENELKQFLFKNDIYINAYTSRLGMEFVVSGHKSDVDVMLDLILEFGLHPALTDDVLAREKEIVLREMSQSMGGPGYRLNRVLIDTVFTPDSCIATEVLGKKEDVSNASIEKLQKIVSAMYRRSHIIITATGGGLEIDQILAKLNNLKEKYPFDSVLPINFQPKNKLKSFSYLPVVHDLGHDHAVLNIVIPCPVTLENRAVRAFFRELLFDHPAGILYNRLRNELGLVYGIHYTFDNTSDSLSIELSCEIQDIAQIITEIKKVFEDFDSIFNQEKVDTIKTIILKRRDINQDDPQFVVNFMISILTDFGVVLNYEDYTKWLERVTLIDIKEFFELIRDNLSAMQVVVVSNKSEIKELKLLG